MFVCLLLRTYVLVNVITIEDVRTYVQYTSLHMNMHMCVYAIRMYIRKSVLICLHTFVHLWGCVL